MTATIGITFLALELIGVFVLTAITPDQLSLQMQHSQNNFCTLFKTLKCNKKQPMSE